ncbi:MAG: hypothetical protein Tp138OMZ00d2C19078261_21 [Prokaryotic dsDNA virus sp.]|jgi:hypothetical protein|nr:MAG: hypothetical protein Tp138OMZ00d2C19078261_21 [Prokaryotic dsDNA virus sp.]|tara:strand:- start:18200 stop:18508 length:309 start_codon:yes stop_codon:yes gene_type:complete
MIHTFPFIRWYRDRRGDSDCDTCTLIIDEEQNGVEVRETYSTDDYQRLARDFPRRKFHTITLVHDQDSNRTVSNQKTDNLKSLRPDLWDRINKFYPFEEKPK